MSVSRPRTIGEGLLNAIAVANTRPLRLLLAIINVIFIHNLIYLSDAISVVILIGSMPFSERYMQVFWTLAFAVHSLYLIKGLSGDYNFYSLMFEGVLGWCLWTWFTLVVWIATGIVPVTLVGTIAMTWILIRYPTHWTRWGSREDD